MVLEGMGVSATQEIQGIREVLEVQGVRGALEVLEVLEVLRRQNIHHVFPLQTARVVIRFQDAVESNSKILLGRRGKAGITL